MENKKFDTNWILIGLSFLITTGLSIFILSTDEKDLGHYIMLVLINLFSLGSLVYKLQNKIKILFNKIKQSLKKKK